MRIPFYLIGATLGLVLLSGCSDDVSTITATAEPSSTATATDVATATPGVATASPTAIESVIPLPTASASPSSTAGQTSTPTNTPLTVITGVPSATPSGTPAGTATGPIITFLGIATAADQPIASSGTDAAGRPIFARELGSGLNLIVEVRPGLDGAPVGNMAFAESGLPDLQLLVSRPLGDGNPAVCDVDVDGLLGGVPAVHPPVYSDASATVDAINDLGCRVNDGTGAPLARRASNQACTRFQTGDFSFVDTATQAQFCLPIAHAWGFPVGDTIVTARARSTIGSIGEPRQMVVRIGRSPTSSPTPSATIPPTPSPTPIAPVITYFGIAAADDRVVAGIDVDESGRDVYGRLIGHAFSLIIEASPGLGGRPVGVSAFADETMLPDLQMLVSRDLGDGSTVVCDVDIENSIFGGVPGIDPPHFDDSAAVLDAINDLGCRVNDGTGTPVGRTSASPCTRNIFGDFTFVNPLSTVQFCLPIARAWSFPLGNTIAAARVRSIDGALSPVAEIVVHIDESNSNVCETGGPGERVFSLDFDNSALRTAGVEGNVAGEWVGTQGQLCAGPGVDGIFPLRLMHEVTIGTTLPDGRVICAKLDAGGSAGILDCAASASHDVLFRAGNADEPIQVQTGLGVAAGTGAASLSLPVALTLLLPPSTADECFGAPFNVSVPLALTTARADAELVDPLGEPVLAIGAQGVNFDCDNWNAEDGPGTWVMPIATTAETSVGESASVFILPD